MVLFKINGERNSGTKFLTQILHINNFPVYDEYTNDEGIVYHWKHGIPSEDYKELDEKVIDLFIFRNLDNWLITFYHHPYHLERHNNFKDFLILPQKSHEKKIRDYRTNNFVNECDNGKTIFQIREYKFNKIMEYKKNNEDVILINLSFIQDEKNLSQFLYFLADKYIKTLKINDYICKVEHTKDKGCYTNRKYNIDINEYRDIIDSNKNEEIENFINGLSFI